MQNNDPGTAFLMLPIDLQCLIACCQAQLSQNDIDLINNFFGTQGTAYETLIELADRHRVLPLVYKTLKKLSDNGLLHASVHRGAEPVERFPALAAFKSAYMQIAQGNMLMSGELLRLIKLLEENGIEALAFKGPALAQMAYGDITLRQFGDLDILVEKADATRAVSLLEADGYLPEILLSGSKKEAFFASVNVIGLAKMPRGVRVEVHWELLAKNYAVFWDMRELRSRTEQVTINGSRVPVPSPADHLLYLCVHGAKHIYERLEWITDVDRTVRTSPPDWQRLFGEAEKMGVTRMVLLSLWLCRELLALPLPETVETRIERDGVAEELGRRIIAMQFGREKTGGKSFGTFGLLWKMREKLSDRLRFTLYGLLLPKFDDFQYLALPKRIVFFYPAVRLFRLAVKYFKR
jgi:hypothetical protein